MSIRKIVSLVAAVAFTAVSAAPAFAVTVSRADGQAMNPNGEPFSATGLTALAKGSINATCNATFNGTISSTGIVNITSTTFTGGATCGLISGSATSASPWTGQADSATQLSINNVKVNVTLLGTCGPSKVVTTWNDPNSSLTFNNAVLTPDCTVGGTVVTSPKFHVQ
ncbi:activator protein [Burkholderia ambifaria]|uniref:activator protein n=1 Tax=Burkholderia TaxID=32008 RepID=UPI0013FDC9DE|nr:activator protein [Burkholderia ambifaria]MBR8345633.1 activator protein [Burkholderia ambifaria]NHL69749.1 activator protein [Burkholderia ambifaria]UEP24282.1 activator protein [Burkholderia ambifaria]WDR87424.1 activator protein [Burkholderia ambifaria]WDS00124.1 activator protein [Burkholderia ambifaria]